MSQYAQLATYKLLTGYGGPESIIETVQGSYRVLQPIVWPYVTDNPQNPKYLDRENRVLDHRLLDRLAGKLPMLQGFYAVPANESNPNARQAPADPNLLAMARRFPSWHYCPKCNRLHKYDGWSRLYKDATGKSDFKRLAKPYCGPCWQDHGRQIFELVQLNYVLAGEHGILEDVPWDFWTTTLDQGPVSIQYNETDGGSDAQEEDSENTSRGSFYQIIKEPCCERQDLRYELGTGTSLASITIRCNSCNRGRSLGNLQQIKLFKKGGPAGIYPRSTNSLYYPLLVYSLRMPTAGPLNAAALDELRPLAAEPDDVLDEAILPKFRSQYGRRATEADLREIRAFLRTPPGAVTEAEFRAQEHRYLTASLADDPSGRADTLRLEDHPVEDLAGVQTLRALRRLSMTTVQLGYTRLEPHTVDQVLADGEAAPGNGVRIMPIQTRAGSLFEQTHLPAVSSSGEGIFVNLDEASVEAWATHYAGAKRDRLRPLLANLQQSHVPICFSALPAQAEQRPLAVRILLVHTLAHLLIKELEYSCGYPATSLRERLYAGPGLAGFLVYAIAGSEGTYGGLVAQAEPEAFGTLWSNVQALALDCSSDPICSDGQDQGVQGNNLAACYACSLLPENSCEAFNGLLDRDAVASYFKFLQNQA